MGAEQPPIPPDRLHDAAEAVRLACLRVAQDGYEQAGMSGLCEEGRWEMVLDALDTLDVDAVLRAWVAKSDSAAPTSHDPR